MLKENLCGYRIGLFHRQPVLDNSPVIEHSPLAVVEQHETERFICERYQGSTELSQSMEAGIGRVYSETFTPLLASYYGEKNVDLFLVQDLAGIKNDLAHSDTGVVVLREKQNRSIVGFTYSLPDKQLERTIGVGVTAILEEYRGQGGWSLMMQNLENGIAVAGKYKKMIRFVRTAGEYAEKVRARYKAGIIDEQIADTDYGNHRQYTINLRKISLGR